MFLSRSFFLAKRTLNTRILSSSFYPSQKYFVSTKGFTRDETLVEESEERIKPKGELDYAS